ncbi:S8 family serine peptidase [candidate division TA06 bacterium]|uniref:S8 family serine peptidase n=1 Tax=candidate division TA06 bacterium TaxID=2250710 RepID=A0A933MJT7_UNCT6|nr:S8 family serine peptidase [candidate division TA06 bacterium]
MKKTLVGFLVLALLGLAGAALADNGRIAISPHMKGVVIFKLKTFPVMDAKGFSCGAPLVDVVLQQHGLDKIKMIYPHKRLAKSKAEQELSKICQAKVSETADIKALCAQLKNTGQVEYAEPRYLRQAEFTPNDPGIGNQWFLTAIQATSAWDISTGDTLVTVGIVDCGVQTTHPDLAANIWLNPGEAGADSNNGIDDDGNGFVDDYRGWDFAGPDLADPSPAGDNNPNPTASNNDHGTHVAGDASAVTNNGVGVAGIGFNCKVMAIKCSYDNDTQYYGQSLIYFGYEGIVYAADNGAQIINCSWGGGGFSQYEQDIINYANGLGSLVVCAAGNDDSPAPHYPSACENAFSVAATENGDAKSSFSNYGATIDISAPGSTIYSTGYPNTYVSWSGTSMASPVAAGVAALVKSYYPSYTNAMIATLLMHSADNIDAQNPAYIGLLGAGRVNAYKALTTTVNSWTRYYSHKTIDGNDNIPRAGETVNLTVTLRNGWDDAPSITGEISTSDYAVNLISTSGNFGSINSGDTASVATYSFTVDSTALPHQALFTVHINTNGDLHTDTFYVQIEQAPVLLVDDDGGASVESYYKDALAAGGVFYNYYEHLTQGTPDSLMLDMFPAVIWSCEWAFPSLDSMDRKALKHYITQGGKLYLSGQDIGWDLQDTTTIYSHEYLLDSAGCTDFYQNYLKATYLGDDGGSSATGIAGDTLTDGLTSAIYQPGRASIEQFPDYFTPNGAAIYCFNYGATTSRAGLHWENGVTGAKLVYTGFGYEAITTSSVRQIFMDRIIRWFLGDISIAHTPLTDTENTSTPYRVAAVISSSVGVKEAFLYYNLDGSAPFEQKLAMSWVGATDTFECFIPAQTNQAVQYYIVAQNSKDLKTAKPIEAPFTSYGFYAGADTVDPVISSTALKNTINLNGPYAVTATVTDNIGLQDSTYLHYRINSGSEYPPVKMTGSGTYNGLITLPVRINTWDTVNYYVTAVDNSSQQNLGRGPVSGYYYFVMADSELVSNFDNSTEIAKWDTTGGTAPWRLFTSTPHTAPYGMRTGTANYASNSNILLTLRQNSAYNLDPYADNGKTVKLFWWQKGILGASDTLFIEGSPDNSAWTNLKARTSLTTAWALDSAEVNPVFSSKGANDTVNFRFRLKSDSTATNAYGWVLDDIHIKVQPILGIAGGRPEALEPKVLALLQNNPNPFKHTTSIFYQLPAETKVSLKVYNVAGQLVRTLVNAKQQAGSYAVKWDGRDGGSRRLAAGVYLYRLSATPINNNKGGSLGGEAGESKFTKKLVLIK